MALLRVGEELFNVVVEGREDAPCLMLAHSLGSDLSVWDMQMPALLPHFRVIRYDSRGHGQSPTEGAPYSMATLGRDALAILDALGMETTHWLGLSLGGVVGQWLLAHAPHRIGRAVLANTAARIGAPAIWNPRIRAARAQGMASLVEGTLERWFTAAFRAAHPDIMETVGTMISRVPAEGYAACCAALRDMDLREEVRAIAAPVLVIVGDADTAAPTETGIALRDSIAGAQLVTLKAAHLSAIEDVDGFSAAVVDFLTAPASKAAGARRAASKPMPRKGVAGRAVARARGGVARPSAPRELASKGRDGKTRPGSVRPRRQPRKKRR